MTNDTSTTIWRHPGLREAACYVAIVLLPWLVLTPALNFDFASDDRIMIVENQLMRDPGNWWRMLTTDAFDRTIIGFDYDVESLVGHYRPINKLSYLIDHTLWGPDSVGFHLTGIGLHLLSGCLLLWLMRIAGVSRPLAVAGALLFMLHPVTGRAVGLISLRADLWCGLFSIAAVATAARAAQTEEKDLRFFVASVLCTFLALLGKEAGIFLPPLFTGVAIVRYGFRRDAWAKIARDVWAYYATVVAYIVIRFGWLQIETSGSNDFPPMTLWTLFQSLSRLFFSYLSELPAPTLVDRLWLPDIITGFPPFTVWLAWLGLAGMVALILWAIRGRHVTVAIGLGLILLPIGPLMNVWAISGEDVGELMPFEMHRLYIPAMGYALLWALSASRVRQLAGPGRIVAFAALGIAVALPVWRYPAELASYADTEAMVRRKLDFVSGFDDAQLPSSLKVLRLNLRAIELKRTGDLDAAEEALKEIQRLQPHDAIALKNLAVIALMKKEPRRTIEYLEKVLQPIQQTDRSGQVRTLIDDPQLRHTGEVHKLLGRAYQMTGALAKAQEHLGLSRKIDPTDLEVLLLQAFVAERQGDKAASRGYLSSFLQQAPPGDPRRVAAERRLGVTVGEG